MSKNKTNGATKNPAKDATSNAGKVEKGTSKGKIEKETIKAAAKVSSRDTKWKYPEDITEAKQKKEYRRKLRSQQEALRKEIKKLKGDSTKAKELEAKQKEYKKWKSAHLHEATTEE